MNSFWLNIWPLLAKIRNSLFKLVSFLTQTQFLGLQLCEDHSELRVVLLYLFRNQFWCEFGLTGTPSLQAFSCWFELKLKDLQVNLLYYSSHFVLCISTTAWRYHHRAWQCLHSKWSPWLHQTCSLSLPMTGLYKLLTPAVFSVGLRVDKLPLLHWCWLNDYFVWRF